MNTCTMRRLGRLHALAETGIVDRHVAPAEELAFRLRRSSLDDARDELAALRVARHEQMRRRRIRRASAARSRASSLPREKTVRNLHQHAAAVAGLRVGADRAAMIEIEQDLQALSTMSCDFTCC
jgi:hypothetical protein